MNQPMNRCSLGGVCVCADPQQIHQVYPADTALRSGTLFPELNKPMACASSPTGCAEATSAQERAFACWEVRLYLNTHPQDECALHLYQQMCRQTPAPNYACTFAPCAENRWSWVDDPWPWECAANERRA